MPVEDADALFDVPPDEFVRARDDLARRLRTEKRGDEARAVRQLRRPTVTVWALNQLARHHADRVDALLEVAQRVGEAQRGGQRDRLREASDELGRRVGELSALAIEALGGEQHSSSRRAELETALRALALGTDATGEWRAGRLQQLPESPSGEEMWAVGVAAGGAAGEGQKADAPDRTEEALARVEAERHVAETDVDRARSRLERAQSRVSDLEKRLDEERSTLAEAESALSSAEERLREAEREVKRLGRKRSS